MAKQLQNLPIKWTGLPSARFLKYKAWINKNHPGICGTYCAAVLVHDAIYHKYRRSIKKDRLLKGLKKVIDDFMPYRGTFFWDVANGLRRILRDQPEYKVRTGLITERIVPGILSGENPRPVIVGTTKFLNSKYKNHWVVAYAYGYDEAGKMFYRAYDNHGNHKAVIPASQTLSCVWLDEGTE